MSHAVNTPNSGPGRNDVNDQPADASPPASTAPSTPPATTAATPAATTASDTPAATTASDTPAATTASDTPAATTASDTPAATTASGTTAAPDRRDVVGRQKDAFGGMKFGSCFFGWLTASGTAVLLAALVTGIGAALGLSRDVQEAGTSPAQTQSVGLVGGIVLLAIIFVAYLAGGYVAGRMARFNGLKQGLGVWLWAVIIAILVAAAGMLAGTRFDILRQLKSFPRLPLNEGTLTTGGIIVAVGVVVVSLVGALLGGLAGMRYHRRVDRAGLGR
jgi:MFS family permease